MKKKLLLILTLGLILSLCLFTMTACNTETDNDEVDSADVIMAKAVEKVDDVSKMMFSAMEAGELDTSPYTLADHKENSVDITSNATSCTTSKNYSSSANPLATIPSDINYPDIWYATAIERQIYVNYVYNVVDYLVQKGLPAGNGKYKKFNLGEVVYGNANY